MLMPVETASLLRALKRRPEKADPLLFFPAAINPKPQGLSTNMPILEIDKTSPLASLGLKCGFTNGQKVRKIWAFSSLVDLAYGVYHVHFSLKVQTKL